MTMILNPSGRVGTVKHVPGRTYVKYYGDELVWAEVFKTPEIASEKMADSRAWQDRKIQEYIGLNLPVPPQYRMWRHEVI